MREVILRTLVVISLVVVVNSLLAQTKSSWVVRFDENGFGPEEINWQQVLDNDDAVVGTKREFAGDFVILILRKDRQLSSDVAFPLHCVNGFNPELLRVFAWEYHGENQSVEIYSDNDRVYQTSSWKQTMFFIIDLSADNVLGELKEELQVEECEEWKEPRGYKVYKNISLGFIDESQIDSRSSYEEQVCWRLKNAIDILNREAEHRSAKLVMTEEIKRANTPKSNGRIMVGLRKRLTESFSATNNMSLQSTGALVNFELMVSRNSLGLEVAPCDAVFKTSWAPSEQSMPWNWGGVDGGVLYVEIKDVQEQIALNFLSVSGLWLKQVNIPNFDESNVIVRFGVPLMKRQFSELTDGQLSYSASVPGMVNRIRNVESLGLVDNVQVDRTWQTEFDFGGWLAGASLQVVNGLGDDSSYFLSTSMDIHRWYFSESSTPVASTGPSYYSSAMSGSSAGLVTLRVSAGIILGR